MMRIALVMIVVAGSLAACRRPEIASSRDIGEPQVVALSVRSVPAGAQVRVSGLKRTWTTPCDIADFSLRRGTLEAEISLDGYHPVRTRVAYDGNDPAWLQVKLVPEKEEVRVLGAAAPPSTPAPQAEAPKPAPVREPGDEPAAKPAPVKIDAVAGGFRLKVTSPNAKVRVQAKTVVTENSRPGEFFLPDVPPQSVTVDFLDPATNGVLQSVEFAPVAAPAAVQPPAPKDPVAADADRVGEVKVVSKTYGVFVKLDPGLSLQPGEEIIVCREGKEVARTKILKITKGDSGYPDGAAQVQKDGSIQKGDEVRRPKN